MSADHPDLPIQGSTRRSFLRASTAAAVGGTTAAILGPASCAGTGAAAARGVVLIVADDLGRGDLGCLGNPSARTPALDAMAAAGMRLERAYTPAALCRPSRTSMLSGLYPHRAGRSWYGELREDLELWPEHFRAHGVKAGTFGKTAVQKNAARWDFCEGGDVGYAKGRDPEHIADGVERFLDLVGTGRFALVVNLFDPHRSDAAAALDPGRLSATRGELKGLHVPPHLPDIAQVKLELRNYYSDVARMDGGAAAVLEVLERRGLSETTLTLFTSDNGADFPFAKGTLYEAGVNMPLLARWPGAVPAGSSSAELVSFMDLLPTCLQALGLPGPGGLDGRSVLPLLRGEAGAGPSELFFEHDEHRDELATPSRAVVTARHKYIRHFQLERRFENASMRTASWLAMEDAAARDPALRARMQSLRVRPREELYDLERDPHELVDLSAEPIQRAVREDLAARLRTWMAGEGDVLLDAWDA